MNNKTSPGTRTRPVPHLSPTKNPPKRGRGRPRREKDVSTEELKGVCTPSQKAAVQAAAERAGESLAQFVTTAALRRAERYVDTTTMKPR